jgi:hypothetical protein
MFSFLKEYFLLKMIRMSKQKQEQDWKMEIREGGVCVLFFRSREMMNAMLNPISDRYEGFLARREGHNFPANVIPRDHLLHKILSKKKSISCLYVVGVYRRADLAHELLHARFYLDAEYRERIHQEWEEMEAEKRAWIERFLERLGYDCRVWIDEYQAYRYSEREGFFGIHLCR